MLLLSRFEKISNVGFCEILSSQLPNVISLLQGHTTLNKMSWTDINNLVKSVIGEMDDM